MAIAFSEDDKSKFKFKAIKAIYPIDVAERVSTEGHKTLSFYDSIHLPEDTDINNCAVIISGSIYQTSTSSNFIDNVSIGEYTIYGGYDADDNFFKYPSVRYYAPAQGWATFSGMVILFE